jgi:phosphoribosylformimino-5-aminoimidazole carboxamide ribonucleotide (ProFAR) isomerase
VLVPFDVIPAIDLWGGRLARMGPEGGVPIGAFGGDPLAAAEEFILAGARWLHVVDLDLAFTGRPGGEQTVSLLAVMDAKVQASGGITTEEHVERALTAGAQRVVLGSAALADREATGRMLERFGEWLAVAVEVGSGRITARGRDDVDLPLDESLDWLRDAGVSRIVYVDVDRVGALAGPDLEGLARTAFRTQRPVVASGGIGTAGDVRAVASVGPMVQGVILGKALYEGKLAMRDAIRAALQATG